MKTITIPAEPLIAAYGEAAVNEIFRKGKRVRKNIVRISAVEVLKILSQYRPLLELKTRLQE